jgi:hypothetical protein
MRQKAEALKSETGGGKAETKAEMKHQGREEKDDGEDKNHSLTAAHASLRFLFSAFPISAFPPARPLPRRRNRNPGAPSSAEWKDDSQGGGLLHNRKASDRRLVRPTLRGALLGLENGTSQGHTTCRGRPIWENPTYSAF